MFDKLIELTTQTIDEQVYLPNTGSGGYGTPISTGMLFEIKKLYQL